MINEVFEIVQCARQGRLIVFCGAGISVLPPSNSPSWWDIYVAVAQALADRLSEAHPDLSPHLHLEKLLAPMKSQQLADLVFSRFAGPTFARLLQVVDIADPNENHRAIALLAAVGGLRAAITTNFDTLIERAAAATGVRFDVAAPGVAASRAPDMRSVLVKIHGTTVEPASLIETSSHKAREISPTLPAAWLPSLAGADVLVLGYSGADLNFGAARAFFSDVLRANCRIWWLYRPGSLPTLPPDVAGKTACIEGQLPDLLRDVLSGLGHTDFETPIGRRDAHAALRSEMTEWSKSSHIGAWAASSFFLALCEHADTEPASRDLLAALLNMGDREVTRFAVGAEIAVSDLGAAGFFSQAGARHLTRLATDKATTLLRASVNIFENMHANLGGDTRNESHDERRMNLSSSWNNLAQASIFGGRTAEAIHAFARALEHAYLGGNVTNCLLALSNILHYGLELKAVRRCKRIADRATTIADQMGSVQSSVEYRMLLALYACDRSEIWSARSYLVEAHRRSKALGDPEMERLASLQLAECSLRAGRIEEGLHAIAAILDQRANTVFFHRPVEEIRRYMAALGIEQPIPFTLRLPSDQVPAQVQRIEDERARAKASGQRPFGGAHCAISDSSHLGRGDANVLVHVGYMDFFGYENAAAEEALGLAEWLVNAAQANDAKWVAENVLARVDIPASVRARAHAALARCASMSARYGQTLYHLEQATRACAEAGTKFSPALAELGVWINIQAGERDAAIPWVKRIVESFTADRQQLSDAVRLASQLESWGSYTMSVVEVLRQGFEGLGMYVPKSTAPDPEQRYRPLRFAPADDVPDNHQVYQLLSDATRLLDVGDAQQAISTLDEIAKLERISENQAGACTALQISAFAQVLPGDQLEAAANKYRRQFLAQLAFGALARLETALIHLDVRANRIAEAADRIRRYGWIAELAEDPVARLGLKLCRASLPSLLGQLALDDDFTRDTYRAGRLIGLVEVDLDPKSTPVVQATSTNVLQEVLQSIANVLGSKDDAESVNQHIREAVRRLRSDRLLSRDVLSSIRGDRANWALRHERFDEAIRGFRAVERTFRALGDKYNYLNAMAGQARALSRSKHYGDAIAVFEKAISEVANSAVRANLLIGLGSAYLLEATRHGNPPDRALLEHALTAYRQAIDAAPLESADRANARLAMARTFGEMGEQQKAIDSFDLAVAELAHVGSSHANTLQKNREAFVVGEWHLIGLVTGHPCAEIP